jgi:hypothetical protein
MPKKLNWKSIVKPHYSHSCPHCTFLGHYYKWDIYFCPQTTSKDQVIPTLLFRASSEPSEYISLPYIVHAQLLSNNAIEEDELMRALEIARLIADERALRFLSRPEVGWRRFKKEGDHGCS